MNANNIILGVIAVLLFLILFPIILTQIGVVNNDANLTYITGGSALFGLMGVLMVLGIAVAVYKKFGGNGIG